MPDNYQVIVIGAGAAGMMAAGRAAELGAKVLLLEKTVRPGQKILISGNGRCNLSNSTDLEDFISRFGGNGRFLYSAFNRFFRDDLLALMERFGTPCRTGPTGKIYPVSDNAQTVVKAFMRYLEEGKVAVQYNTALTGVVVENGKVTAIETTAGIIPVSALIIAAGGSSHPQTGSDGSGYEIAAKLGHTIVRLRPGLVPLIVKDEKTAKEMQGASLRKVRVTAFQCPADKIDISLFSKTDIGLRLSGKRPKLPMIESRTGDAIITHFGLSGPVCLELSLAIVDALENGPVSVAIDLRPDQDYAALKAELQQAFDKRSSLICQNAIRRFMPKKIVETFLKMANVLPDKLSHQITAEERDSVVSLMKCLKFDIKSPYSMAAAMVTAGGISLKEINPRTMASQKVDGLYFCGEILDLDAGTGGFNLQAAFSTGYVAGESAAIIM
jgi:predicted flavoprotein YhiN